MFSLRNLSGSVRSAALRMAGSVAIVTACISWMGCGGAGTTGSNSAPPEGFGQPDQAGLNLYVNSQNESLRECYVRELETDPTLQGRIQIQFSVDSFGAVYLASIRNNELNDSIADCILSLVRQWAVSTDLLNRPAITVRRTYLFEPGE